MNIGPHTFAEFARRAAELHSYPAPGLLVGGYMVEAARRRLPPGALFEALVETPKCLPDAVQLLTPCSLGNGRLKILDLGRYALTLFDKYTGAGWRAGLDPSRLFDFSEYHAWFMKIKPKAEQDEARLLAEIEAAGDAVCRLTPVRVPERFLGHDRQGPVRICPDCGESFPVRDGERCRACRGGDPYLPLTTA